MTTKKFEELPPPVDCPVWTEPKLSQSDNVAMFLLGIFLGTSIGIVVWAILDGM